MYSWLSIKTPFPGLLRLAERDRSSDRERQSVREGFRVTERKVEWYRKREEWERYSE